MTKPKIKLKPKINSESQTKLKFKINLKQKVDSEHNIRLKQQIKSDDQLNQLNYYTTHKNSLNNILSANSNSIIKNRINDAVIRTNKIIIHTYFFLKLYLIHCFNNHLDFPLINEKFLEICMKTVAKKTHKAGRKPTQQTQKIMEPLITFFNQEYTNLITDPDHEIVNFGHLMQVLKYEAIDMLTNIKNNISANYIDHLNALVNLQFGIKEKINQINQSNATDKQKRKDRKIIYDLYRPIKQDLLNPDSRADYQSQPQFHQWIQTHKAKLIPTKIFFSKNNIYYDVKASPLNYLPCMIYINQLLESINLTKDENDPQKRLFHAIPLRTDIKPKYITFDTTCLIELLEDNNKNQYRQNVIKCKDKIWGDFFLLNQKCFKRGQKYVFNHQIKTDGVGVSILLIRKDLLGQTKIKQKTAFVEQYIDEIEITNNLKKKKIVAIDPNKRDIIYCSDQNVLDQTQKKKRNKNSHTFRYTANQRRMETRNNKYNKIIDNDKKITIINNQTIKQLETQLSKYNSKTCRYQSFQEYVKTKNELNHQLFDYYQLNLFRKLTFNRFINTQKSESQMIKNFKQTFGPPEDVLIAFGDHEQKKQMKYHEPTKDIGMRRLFRRFGYQVYLVEEHRTSCRCYRCGNQTEKFLKRESSRPWRKGHIVEVNGLLRCQSVTCKTVYNRDYNATQNILKICECALSKKPRPLYLCRGVKLPIPAFET